MGVVEEKRELCSWTIQICKRPSSADVWIAYDNLHIQKWYVNWRLKRWCVTATATHNPQRKTTSASLTGYLPRATVLGFWLDFGVIVLDFRVLGVAVVDFFAVLGRTVHLGWIFMNHEIKHGSNLVVFVADMTLHWNCHFYIYVSASWRMFPALVSIAALVSRLVFDVDAVFANVKQIANRMALQSWTITNYPAANNLEAMDECLDVGSATWQVQHPPGFLCNNNPSAAGVGYF